MKTTLPPDIQNACSRLAELQCHATRRMFNMSLFALENVIAGQTPQPAEFARNRVVCARWRSRVRQPARRPPSLSRVVCRAACYCGTLPVRRFVCRQRGGDIRKRESWAGKARAQPRGVGDEAWEVSQWSVMCHATAARPACRPECACRQWARVEEDMAQRVRFSVCCNEGKAASRAQMRKGEKAHEEVGRREVAMF